MKLGVVRSLALVLGKQESLLPCLGPQHYATEPGICLEHGLGPDGCHGHVSLLGRDFTEWYDSEEPLAGSHHSAGSSHRHIPTLGSPPLRVTKSPTRTPLEPVPVTTGNGFAMAIQPMATSLQTWPCALATKAAGPIGATHALGVRPAGTHTWHLFQTPFSSQKIWALGLGLSVAQDSRPVWPEGTMGIRKAAPFGSLSSVRSSRRAGALAVCTGWSPGVQACAEAGGQPVCVRARGPGCAPR